MAQFNRTGITNLIRHENGTYYLQAKVAGQKVRRSLKTKSKDLARHILPKKLQELRAEHASATPILKDVPVSILDHLEKWKAEQRARTDIRENTKASYMVTSKWVLSRFPNDGTPGELNQELWTEVVEKYSASTANKILTILKALTSSMAAAGALQVDPYASLKQLDPPSAEVDPLSIHQIQEVIESIRSQGCLLYTSPSPRD